MLNDLQRGLDTPWKAFNEARRLALVPVARTYFWSHGVGSEPRWRIYGLPLIQRHRGSSITLGSDLVLRSWASSNPLGTQRCVLATWTRSARLEIESGVKATGVVICAADRISIGADVRIGSGVMIIDTDFHPLQEAERAADPRAGRSGPITIERGVFVGARAIILKGSHIGEGAVIGAGSVVSGVVEPGTLVAGNPARVVRSL
jgi:acetyltransferase-like isoleucine patch superfamily enzyme